MPLFVRTEQVHWSSPFTGVKRVNIAGQGLSLSLCHVQPGFSSPPERHPEEQVNVVLRGTMELVLGEEQNEVFVRGEATDPVKYLAAPENRDLGVVKRLRKKKPDSLNPETPQILEAVKL